MCRSDAWSAHFDGETVAATARLKTPAGHRLVHALHHWYHERTTQLLF